MKYLHSYYFRTVVLFIMVVIAACSNLSSENRPLKIAISRERKDVDVRYGTWLEYQKKPMKFINLYDIPYDQVLDSLRTCDALLLSGGEDIYPGLFGKEQDTNRCGTINTYRDSLEFMLYADARRLKMPVLGICRGLQLINVAEGGSLFIDLPADNNSGELHRIGQEDWSQHIAVISKASEFHKVICQDSIVVESNHHQGIDRMAASLQSLAVSSDGLVESVTTNESKSGFLLAVQWHPEWAKRTDEPSGKIAALFLEEAKMFRKSK
ncbi:MAG: gamma-glutamyl-gamma-aminobutyrate hydrolase family protein [Bacteroidales bacterium]|nr:gamma-glutamyl-gamma-aminobutyrate hydrolase family protein [Bacteroidales bacterium]